MRIGIEPHQVPRLRYMGKTVVMVSSPGDGTGWQRLAPLAASLIGRVNAGPLRLRLRGGGVGDVPAGQAFVTEVHGPRSFLDGVSLELLIRGDVPGGFTHAPGSPALTTEDLAGFVVAEIRDAVVPAWPQS